MTRHNLFPLILLLMLLASTALVAQDLTEELFNAARKGDAAAVGALLDKGVDVNTKFRYGATALSYACDKGHLEVVKALLAHKADVNVKDTFYKATPIIWAAEKGHAEIVRALLDHGAEGREDALIIGAQGGHVELVKVVLAGKGDLKAATLSSAYAAAERNKNAEIVALLKQAGAVPPPKADFQVDAATLNSYVGAYKPETGGDVNLALKDGKLTVNFAGQIFTLGAFDKVTFRPLEFDGVTLTMNVENGAVTGFTFKQGDTSRVFKRVQP